jgi:hypothetical protein
LIVELLAWSFVVFFSWPAPAQEKKVRESHGAAELAAAAEGYRSNREVFEFFSCRFTETRGKAQSLQDAMDGKFIDPVATQYRWIVNKKNVKSEVTGDPALLAAALAKPRVGDTISVPFTPETTLTDGVIQMRYSTILKGANIWPPGVEGVGVEITPFGLGNMGTNDVANPGRVLRDCADGKLFGSYDGSTQVDGAELLMFSQGDDGHYQKKYLIDPKKGFNPIQITGQAPQGKQLAYRAFFTYRQCSGQRWFPERGLDVSLPEGDPPFYVREVKVVELDTETPPALSEFYLDMPDGTQVSVPGSKGGYYYTKGQEHVKLTDLQGVYDRCQARLAKDAELEQTQAPTPWYRKWIYIVDGIAVTLLVAVSAWLYFRKRKPQATPGG